MFFATFTAIATIRATGQPPVGTAMGNAGNGHQTSDAQPRRPEPERAGRRPLELAMADYYRRQGFSVTQLPDDNRDRDFDGIDLLLRAGDKTIVVACRDRVQPLFHHELQSLQRRLPRIGANMLIVVTPDAFDAHAREIGDRSSHLQLVDGKLLGVLLGEARMDALARDLAAARAAYPRAARADGQAPSANGRPLAFAIASALLLALVLLLGWLALRQRGDAAESDKVPDASGPSPAG
jgi:hypothetical protein